VDVAAAGRGYREVYGRAAAAATPE